MTKHGGKRPGSGRPKSDLTETKRLSFTAENKKRLDAENNASRLVNRLLDDYYEAEGKTKNDASNPRGD